MDVKIPAVPNLRDQLLRLNVPYLTSIFWVVVPRRLRWEGAVERVTGGGADG